MTAEREGRDELVHRGLTSRVAALDIGSNAIRFLAAEFAGAEGRVLETRRYSVRLGSDVFTAGRLSADSVDATIRAAAGARERMNALRVDRYRAVATSAVRESDNSEELIARLRDEAGLELETITGLEEAWLVWSAVRRRMAIEEGRWLLADLGGGSVEITLVDAGEVITVDSYPAGAVRLLESLDTNSADPVDLVSRLEDEAARRLPLEHPSLDGVRGLVITGGSAEALGDVVRVRAGQPPRRIDASTESYGAVLQPHADAGERITLDELRAALAELESLSFRGRIERFCLRRDRADVIVPAAVVFARIARLANITELLIPRVGLKEGIVFELAERSERGASLSTPPV